MTTFTLTKPEIFGIQYIDTFGNVINAAPAPDSPPTWSNTDSTVVGIQEPSNDLTATLTPLKPGSVTIGVTVIVAAVTFTGSITVTVPNPSLASIQIVQVA